MIEIRLLDPAEVAFFWPQMVEGVEKSLNRHTDRPTSEILTTALRRGILVWGAIEDPGRLIGFTFVEIQGSRLAVVALGGERSKEWIGEVNDQIRQLYESDFYDSVVASVRPGLEKWLKPLGWKKYRVLMEIQ